MGPEVWAKESFAIATKIAYQNGLLRRTPKRLIQGQPRRKRATVAETGRFRFSGSVAWLAWLFVHLSNLIEFENKLLVLIQWGWYYMSRNRAARLITNDLPSAQEREDERRAIGHK